MAVTKPAYQQRPRVETPAANAVAVLQPPRLPYLPSLQQEYGINEQGWRTLIEAVFPAAKTIGAVQLALDYCKHRKLDVFKKPVHIVPIWSSAKNCEVETVWPGIADHRTTAMRTGNYAGMDIPVFGPERVETFKGRNKKWVNGSETWEDEEVEVAYPEWCQITLYRLLQGQRVPFPGPKVYWLETYARKSRWTTVPNEMWQKRSSGQLEKCAEAAALRRAFPEELGDEWTMEEVGAFQTHAPLDVTGDSPVSAEPRREEFAETPPATTTDVIDQAEIVFERLSGPKAFFDFSDHFLQQPTTTPDMARKWEEFYREEMNKMAVHDDLRVRQGVADTIGLYSDVIAREEPQQ